MPNTGKAEIKGGTKSTTGDPRGSPSGGGATAKWGLGDEIDEETVKKKEGVRRKKRKRRAREEVDGDVVMEIGAHLKDVKLGDKQEGNKNKRQKGKGVDKGVVEMEIDEREMETGDNEGGEMEVDEGKMETGDGGEKKKRRRNKRKKKGKGGNVNEEVEQEGQGGEQEVAQVHESLAEFMDRVNKQLNAQEKGLQKRFNAQEKELQKKFNAQEKGLQKKFDAEKKEAQEKSDAEKKEAQEKFDAEKKEAQEKSDAEKKEVQKKFDAEKKEVRKKFSAQKKEIRALKKRCHRSELLHETAINSTILPIVAAVVYKNIYSAATGAEKRFRSFYDSRSECIESYKDDFAYFGMESAEEMTIFAETWNAVIGLRNSAAHKISGNDVVAVLPYATDNVQLVLKRGFKFLFGITVEDWGEATMEQKNMKIED